MKLFNRWKDSFNPRPCTWITKGTTYFSPWSMSTRNRVRYLVSMSFSILIVTTLFGAMVAGFNFVLGTVIGAIYSISFDLIHLFWMSFGIGFLLAVVPFTVAQLRYWFSPRARVNAHNRYNFNMVHSMVDLAKRGIESSTIIESPSAAEKRSNAADWSGEEAVNAEYEEVIDPNRTLH